ncbi:MAG TPA: 4-(cytidine 5'-diphospho)-2-C-methyl-D-erythritol kinase [Acidimicrobiales bacterium]|jgi:4-diphosphocytidyl-2-C-methyl-D-erythritol kinase|nr:4-(cytidine 5'-diphospho)-2-C-methyl-D-erythritol kinase [Acidimicrobiales bacterium]
MPHVERAPAKLTVSLRVTGVRADGYHLLDAEMVTLDLVDTLTFTDGDGIEVVAPAAVEGAGGTGSGFAVPTGPTNTVARALAAVGCAAHVRIDKGIPSGGGLGGASADAAAVLRWAGVRDPAVAVRIGADVPFCVTGGRARVRGVGEQVEPLPFQARTFTLALAPFGCSTPAVYQAWDDLGGPVGPHANDLEAAALAVEPRMAEWRDRFGEATGQTPMLAGSGSTWFVEGAFPGESRLVVHTTPAMS